MSKYAIRQACQSKLTIAVGLAIGASTAQATTFSVTTNADAGPGSLRQAIVDANADTLGAPHILDFSAISGQTITLADNLTPIAISMDLQGADVTLSGADAYSCIAVPFDSYNPDIDLVVQDMTITGCVGYGTAPGRGGAILGDQYGSVTLDNVTVTGNTAGSGGGLRVADMDLTILNSVISDNVASDGFGGGVNHTGGAFVMDNSQVSGNSATGSGGGVYTTKYGADISNSTISRNSGYDGGGLFSYQKYGTPTTTLQNVTITENTAANDAGGTLIYNGDEDYDMQTTLSQVTIAANSAANLGGGALFVQYYGPTHNVEIDNSIIAGNSSGAGGADIEGSVVGSPGRGFYRGQRSEEQLRADFKPKFHDLEIPQLNSLVRGVSIDVVMDVAYSLLGSIPANPVTFNADAATTQAVGEDPMLGPLQNNGGLTLTHEPSVDGAAMNFIPQGINGCGSVLTVDQRGAPRPFVNSDCEAGAVEFGQLEAAPVPTLNHWSTALLALGLGLIGWLGFRRRKAAE